MNERQLISAIGGIARLSGSLDEAVGLIENLLTREVGSATLQLRPAGDSSQLFAGPAVMRFLESKEFPFRGMYTAPIVQGGQSRATLVAYFGAWGAPGELLRRATSATAEHLAMLLARVGRAPVAA